MNSGTMSIAVITELLRRWVWAPSWTWLDLGGPLPVTDQRDAYADERAHFLAESGGAWVETFNCEQQAAHPFNRDNGDDE